MLLYCPNCQKLLEKVNEQMQEGKTIVKTCEKCKKTISFYVKYKAISSVLTNINNKCILS